MRKIQSVIEQVTWERIHVAIKIRMTEAIPSQTRYFLCDKKQVIFAELFPADTCTDNSVVLNLNVTNNGLNQCIPGGIYFIYATDGTTFYSVPGFVGNYETLSSWGRTFAYRSNTGLYSVIFLLDEYAEESIVQVRIFNAAVDNNSLRTRSFAETKKKIKKILKNVAKSIVTPVVYGFSKKFLKKKDKKNLLFLSEQSDIMPQNMRAVYDRLKKRGEDKNFHIAVSLRRKTSVKQSPLSTIKMIMKLGAADIIIVDDHVPIFDWFVLKNTTIIQIWHAGAGFKGVGYSRWGHDGCPGPFSAHRQNTYSISGSKAISHFFSEQFGILDEQVIPTGMPRMDEYLDPDNRVKVTQALREKYPQIIERQVILFAPTYRGRNRANAYYPYELIDFEKLYRLCEEKNAVVLFKMHPWVSQEVPIPEQYSDRFICMNSYPNINDLFYVSDLYITDYSSGMYEFSLMRKPMLFFVYDKMQYSTSRGFHRDYDSVVPGKIVMSFEELLEAIEKDDYEFEKVEDYIKHHFDSVDTNSCDRVIDWLILGNLPDEYREALTKKQQQVKDTIGSKLEIED